MTDLLKRPLEKNLPAHRDGGPGLPSNMNPEAFKTIVRKGKEYIVAATSFRRFYPSVLTFETTAIRSISTGPYAISSSPYPLFPEISELCLIGSSRRYGAPGGRSGGIETYRGTKPGGKRNRRPPACR
jgi:hypothetical protein